MIDDGCHRLDSLRKYTVLLPYLTGLLRCSTTFTSPRPLFQLNALLAGTNGYMPRAVLGVPKAGVGGLLSSLRSGWPAWANTMHPQCCLSILCYHSFCFGALHPASAVSLICGEPTAHIASPNPIVSPPFALPAHPSRRQSSRTTTTISSPSSSLTAE